MKNTRLKLLLAALLALLVFAQPASAITEEATETAMRLSRTLKETNFKADVVFTIVGEESESLSGRLYRQPPRHFRLEYYEDEELVGYYLEDGKGSTRVFPREQKVLHMRRQRLSPIFALIAACLDRSLHEETLATVEERTSGRATYVLNGFAGEKGFSAVFDTEDELLRVFTADEQKGQLGFRVELNNVEIVAPGGFAPGLFAPPVDFQVIGSVTQVPESQRERLRKFQERLPQQRHRPKVSEELHDAEEADADDFLPALPTHLPEGFIIESVTPLYFSGRLLYHIELANVTAVQLVSVFETKHEEFRKEFQNTWRKDGKRFLDLPLGQTGIYVILISEDVKEDALQLIYDSMEFQPELAVQLIDKALAGILSE
jgi:outer membrane lipoprotein-sorting protein